MPESMSLDYVHDKTILMIGSMPPISSDKDYFARDVNSPSGPLQYIPYHSTGCHYTI